MSGDDYTKVNFGGMDEAQANFLRVHKAFNSVLQDLDTSIRTHLADWEGDARAAYTQAQARWNAASGRMATAVQDLGRAIAESNEGYRRTEKINATMWP